MGRRSRSPKQQARFRNAALGLVAITCALVIAACGSSQHPNHMNASGYSKLLRYSDCMRSHGVSNFPDPEDGGYPLRTAGVNRQAPAFESATVNCAKLRPGRVNEPAPITSRQVYEMAKKARCIRKHGFPNFPDPTLASGGHLFTNSPGTAWNPMAPAEINARKACANVGITIPGWGSG